MLIYYKSRVIGVGEVLFYESNYLTNRSLANRFVKDQSTLSSSFFLFWLCVKANVVMQYSHIFVCATFDGLILVEGCAFSK